MWALITIKRTKDLNYFSLCALNLFNTQVSQFELNYCNKWTFPQNSNLLRCTCINKNVAKLTTAADCKNLCKNSLQRDFYAFLFFYSTPWCVQFTLLALKKNFFFFFFFFFNCTAIVFLGFASQFYTILRFSWFIPCFIGNLCHANSD